MPRHALVLLVGLVATNSVLAQEKKDRKKELFEPLPPLPVVAVDRKEPVSFDKDIAPILDNKCAHCHSGAVKDGRFDLGSFEAMMKGGKTGPAIVPGKPDESFLVKLVGRTGVPAMPPKDEEPLTPEELALVKLWIAQGAKGPTGNGGDRSVKRVVKLGRLPERIKPVIALALSSDKSMLAVGRGAHLELYDVATGHLLRNLVRPDLKDDQGAPLQQAQLDLVHALAISPDGRFLAAGGFQEVVIWDVHAGSVWRTLTGFADRVVALDFSPDGKRLATGGGVPTGEGEVRVFSIPSGDLQLDLKAAHSDVVMGVRFSPDGTRLATCGTDKFVKVFAMVPTPAERTFANLTARGSSFVPPLTLPIGTPGHAMAKALEFSGLALTEPPTPVAPGTQLRSFEGHTHHVQDVTWRGDGMVLASVGADNVVKVWDFSTGDQIRTIGGHGKQITRLVSVGASPNIATACGDALIRMWNMDNGGNYRNFGGAADFLFAVAVSADGTIVAAGGQEGIVRIYNGANGQLVKALPTAEPKK